jgi:hypothetical protein
MEKWRIPDAISLELIEFAGKLGKNGKRPRFRFTTRQQRITSYLPEIDAALAAAGKDQNWLHRQIKTAPFTRRSPIEHMLVRGPEGMSDVLQRLNREAMRRFDQVEFLFSGGWHVWGGQQAGRRQQCKRTALLRLVPPKGRCQSVRSANSRLHFPLRGI